MRRTYRAAAVAAAVFAVAVPTAAQAGQSKPTADGNYCMNCTKKLSPGTFHVSKDGKSIDGFTYYNKCSGLPIPKMPVIAISKGKFSFQGKLKDVLGKKYTFTLKGHFVSPKLAKGVVNATGNGKTCSAVPFTARFTRTGPFSF